MASDESTKFIISMFARHYKEADLEMPERFSKREFGFMLFDRPGMIRHTGFSNRTDLKRFLTDRVPAHVYYSSAYYEKPAAQTMAEKNWLGADLIFDLDADHVRGAEKLPYEQMLHRVKEEVTRLLDEFILHDLGFDAEDVRIVFSGGRGYHLHIGHPSVIRLSSHERREIVDYITGTDLDVEILFPKTPIEIRRFKENVHTVYSRRMPKSADGGWFARIRHGIDSLFDEMERMTPEEQRSHLAKMMADSGIKIGPKTADGLYRELFEGDVGKRGIDKMRNEDNVEVFSDDRHLRAFLDLVRKGMAPAIAGETDEPVTSDIKRLIRMPGSLHGKTGFEVVPLERDDLDNFDPFRDAVPDSFGNDDVDIVCEKSVDVRMKETDYSLEAGRNSVPAHVAVHLICRRLATLRS